MLNLAIPEHLLGSAFGVAVALSCVAVLVYQLIFMISDRGRDNLDPPSSIFIPVMPLIRLVAFYGTSNLPDKILDRVETKLTANGATFACTSEEFLAAKGIYALLSLVLTLAAFGQISVNSVALACLLGVVGWVIPELWLKDLKKKRDREVLRTLPIFLEYLTMCVEAGLNLNGAFKQAVEKGPPGAIRNEFRIILRDISSGYTKADALLRFEQRVNSQEVTSMVKAVNQADRMGASLSDTLRSQAEQRLDERFQKAEKLAMEAPVKLIVPLVIFIFPLTFIVLLFPIFMRFWESG